jgi:hypothetical protein
MIQSEIVDRDIENTCGTELKGETNSEGFSVEYATGFDRFCMTGIVDDSTELPWTRVGKDADDVGPHSGLESTRGKRGERIDHGSGDGDEMFGIMQGFPATRK